MDSMPVYRRLPHALRRQLKQHVLVFLAEKRFYGCGGLELTEEMRVRIAAQACLLIVNRARDHYSKLYSILVYPSAFIVEQETRDEAGVHTTELQVRSGESWEVGRVIVAWDEVEHTRLDMSDGHNVVFHEFAHQLDQENGAADGTPILTPSSRYPTWARVLGKEYAGLRADVAGGRPTVLDEYGAETPGEFFAVATEAFFTKPAQLKSSHSDLYAELQAYYGVDPTEWC